MRKFIRGTLLIIAVCFLLTGCRQNEEHGEQEDTMPIVAFQMIPSSEGVEDFLKLLGGYRGDYDDEHCYNVTPEDIANNYNFSIFKFDKSCSIFLLYDDKEYPLGKWFGSHGVDSFAVADLNEDGRFELYFTGLKGSGIISTYVGYFDAASKETVFFDFHDPFQTWMLDMDSDNTLCVYDADYHVKSYVDIEMFAREKVASIIFDGENISLIEE